MTDLVTTEINDGVIIIRLHRTDKKNALTGDMYNGISDALDQLENDSSLRVGLITGSEDCFTAGNDLVDFMENSSGIGGDSPVARFLRTIPHLKKPLVAAVNGPAVGVGTTMLLHCDMVFAAPTAKFSMPFVNLGLCPEAGSSLLVPQLVGYRRAAQLLMLGEAFTSDQAKEMGIVSEVVAENYQDYALAKAKQLAQQPPQSVRVTKQLLRQSNEAFLKAVMKAEEDHFSSMLQGPEAKEAFAAFFEKRKPDFSKFG